MVLSKLENKTCSRCFCFVHMLPENWAGWFLWEDCDGVLMNFSSLELNFSIFPQGELRGAGQSAFGFLSWSDVNKLQIASLRSQWRAFCSQWRITDASLRVKNLARGIGKILRKRGSGWQEKGWWLITEIFTIGILSPPCPPLKRGWEERFGGVVPARSCSESATKFPISNILEHLHSDKRTVILCFVSEESWLINCHSEPLLGRILALLQNSRCV